MDAREGILLVTMFLQLALDYDDNTFFFFFPFLAHITFAKEEGHAAQERIVK